VENKIKENPYERKEEHRKEILAETGGGFWSDWGSDWEGTRDGRL
jgi:hypothetical protein